MPVLQLEPGHLKENNNGSKKNIFVYADWHQLKGPKLMGVLTSQSFRGEEIFYFEYDRKWLESDFAFVLDPDLQKYRGPQYINDESKPNFGLFMDSSPDRWGRVLLRRREEDQARKEERDARRLADSDFLLGVYDGTRSGGLRFKISPEGSFLNDDKEMSTPPIANIRMLEETSLKFESEEVSQDKEYAHFLKQLIDAGSSLGGARPKVNIIDNDNSLWIAKFPSRNDQQDNGAWEMVAHDLGKACGINVCEARIEKYASNYSTYLSKRFDRVGSDKRVHYASAMTMLGLNDGASAATGISYIEIAEFIITHGSSPTNDLRELFKRIAFSICISNTDDHLRNHGFILTRNGWELSPAFDINPNPFGTGLSLNIDIHSNALNFDLLLSTSDYYRIPKEKAEELVRDIRNTVGQWPKIAASHGLSRKEMELMTSAFNQIDRN